jgi:hypothetical protein
MNRAFDAHSRRAEPIYFMCKWFREHGQNHKAYHDFLKGKNIPYPKDDVLFIEDAVYSGVFEYGNTILACYVNDKSCLDSLCDVVSYLNRGVPHRGTTCITTESRSTVEPTRALSRRSRSRSMSSTKCQPAH